MASAADAWPDRGVCDALESSESGALGGDVFVEVQCTGRSKDSAHLGERYVWPGQCAEHERCDDGVERVVGKSQVVRSPVDDGDGHGG